MLVTNGGAGGKNTQRYKNSEVCIGGEETFQKASAIGGKQLGSGFELSDKESFSDMEGTVTKVLQWIERTFDEDNKVEKKEEEKKD